MTGTLGVAGGKASVPVALEAVWSAICTDLSDRVLVDGAGCHSGDDCIAYVADVCHVELGLTCNRDVTMSLFAHLSPHVLLPNTSTCYAFLLCDKMEDVIGRNAASHLRSKLVRAILRVAGPPTPLSEEALLQDVSIIKTLMFNCCSLCCSVA